jgi:predicted NUDIX family NTP pyrophosphohydrolase
VKQQSAGLIIYRKKESQVEVLIVHPGGPFWVKKDLGAWSIPKGLYEENEEALQAAYREFEEEVGQPAPEAEAQPLGTIEQRNNKDVTAWAVEGDLGDIQTKSNTFTMEWPPKSGNKQEFPEVDRAEWFSLPQAAQKLNPDQLPFLERLAKLEGVGFNSEVPTEDNQQHLL